MPDISEDASNVRILGSLVLNKKLPDLVLFDLVNRPCRFKPSEKMSPDQFHLRIQFLEENGFISSYKPTPDPREARREARMIGANFFGSKKAHCFWLITEKGRQHYASMVETGYVPARPGNPPVCPAQP